MYTLTIASRMLFLPKITVIMYKMMALFDIKSPYVEAHFIGLVRMKSSNSKKKTPQFFEDDLRLRQRSLKCVMNQSIHAKTRYVKVLDKDMWLSKNLFDARTLPIALFPSIKLSDKEVIFHLQQVEFLLKFSIFSIFWLPLLE